MARRTVKQRREQAEALRAQVEQSRREWLGKRVRFTDLLDDKIKVGVFTKVTDDGYVTMEYQMFPWWPDEPPAVFCTQVGYELELLDLVDGVVIDEGEQEN